MVTKKTRLLSAIAAVLMLVSMFAGFVIPVTAAETTYPSITDYHNGKETNAAGSYTVSTVKELELLSVYKATLTGTIYITGDIDVTGWTANTYSDISGDVHAMTGLKASLDGYPNGDKGVIRGLNTPATGWLNNHNTGKTIKNLRFVDCHNKKMTANYGLLGGNGVLTTLYENLEFYQCTVEKTGNGGNGMGFVIGRPGTSPTFRNILIEECQLIDPVGYLSSGKQQGPSNYGFLLGTTTGSSRILTIENVYLINNTIDAECLDNAHGLLVGEVSKAGHTVKNILAVGTEFLYNKAQSTTTNFKTSGALIGALCGGASGPTNYDTEMTIENVIMVNTTTNLDGYFNHLVGGVNQAYGVSTLNISNIYTDRTSLGDAANINGGINQGANCTLGVNNALEGAFALNAAGVETKWGLTADGELTFVKAGEKEVKAVTVEIRNPEDGALIKSYSDYTAVNGKLLKAEDYVDQAVLWTEPVDGAITGSTVIGYVMPEHTCQIGDYTSKGDGTHTYACTCEWTVENVGTITCDVAGEGTCDRLSYTAVKGAETEEPDTAHKVLPACSLCGYQAEDAAEELCPGRLYEDSTSAPTSCKPEDAGAIITKCTKCDYTHTKVVLGEDLHVFDKFINMEDQPNYHEIVCSVCDHPSGDLAKHVFGDWEETLAPGVDTLGEETRTCACGKKETRPKAKKVGVELTMGEAFVNQTFEVAVDLKNSTGIAGLGLEVTYDPDQVRLISVEKGDWTHLIFPGEVPADKAATGAVTLNMLNPNNMYGDGTLVVLTFQVADNAELYGEKAGIQVNIADAKSYELEEVTVEGTVAEAEILMMKGDMNNDGTVNMIDANLMLRYFNEKGTASKAEIGGILITDVMADLCDEGDGEMANNEPTPEFNINDVIYLLRYLNGQIEL